MSSQYYGSDPSYRDLVDYVVGRLPTTEAKMKYAETEKAFLQDHLLKAREAKYEKNATMRIEARKRQLELIKSFEDARTALSQYTTDASMQNTRNVVNVMNNTADNLQRATQDTQPYNDLMLKARTGAGVTGSGTPSDPQQKANILSQLVGTAFQQGMTDEYDTAVASIAYQIEQQYGGRDKALAAIEMAETNYKSGTRGELEEIFDKADRIEATIKNMRVADAMPRNIPKAAGWMKDIDKYEQRIQHQLDNPITMTPQELELETEEALKQDYVYQSMKERLQELTDASSPMTWKEKLGRLVSEPMFRDWAQQNGYFIGESIVKDGKLEVYVPRPDDMRAARAFYRQWKTGEGFDRPQSAKGNLVKAEVYEDPEVLMAEKDGVSYFKARDPVEEGFTYYKVTPNEYGVGKVEGIDQDAVPEGTNFAPAGIYDEDGTQRLMAQSDLEEEKIKVGFETKEGKNGVLYATDGKDSYLYDSEGGRFYKVGEDGTPVMLTDIKQVPPGLELQYTFYTDDRGHHAIMNMADAEKHLKDKDAEGNPTLRVLSKEEWRENRDQIEGAAGNMTGIGPLSESELLAAQKASGRTRPVIGKQAHEVTKDIQETGPGTTRIDTAEGTQIIPKSSLAGMETVEKGPHPFMSGKRAEKRIEKKIGMEEARSSAPPASTLPPIPAGLLDTEPGETRAMKDIDKLAEDEKRRQSDAVEVEDDGKVKLPVDDSKRVKSGGVGSMEAEFQAWYAPKARKYGLQEDSAQEPDYDWRKAFEDRQEPDEYGQLPTKYKKVPTSPPTSQNEDKPKTPREKIRAMVDSRFTASTPNPTRTA